MWMRSAATVSSHAPLALFAIRPSKSPGFQNLRKIQTLGIRAAFVGEFAVRDHELPSQDIIAEGRDAWNAVFGTVNLGKFFLGFASIGMCERAFQEAKAHLRSRVLYNKPAIAMPHLGFATALAYVRLTAMKLYAYRALDYVHAATADDRRYLLFTAVQKARVSTEGVKVMALLSECIGAKGFESATFFEMAMRDVQLIPRLEGSAHINLGQTAQFIPAYFSGSKADLPSPLSLTANPASARENPYLFEAQTGSISSVQFSHFLSSLKPWSSLPNVRLFSQQVRRVDRMLKSDHIPKAELAAARGDLLLGELLAIIAYAQLIAENALHLNLPAPVVATVFHTLISDLSASALALAASPSCRPIQQLARRIVAVPHTTVEEWASIEKQM